MIECEPSAGVIVQLAVSGELSLSATFWQPEMALAPSEKLTVPVGMPVPGDGTVTVSVYATAVPWLTLADGALTVLDVPTAGMSRR